MIDRNLAGVSVFQSRFGGDKIVEVTPQGRVGGRTHSTATRSWTRHKYLAAGQRGAVARALARLLSEVVTKS